MHIFLSFLLDNWQKYKTETNLESSLTLPSVAHLTRLLSAFPSAAFFLKLFAKRLWGNLLFYFHRSTRHSTLETRQAYAALVKLLIEARACFDGICMNLPNSHKIIRSCELATNANAQRENIWCEL